MLQKNIKNIIFDYGNMIINLSIDATYQAFKKLGTDDFANEWEAINNSNLFPKYERGDISTIEFREILKTALPKTVKNEEIDWAWNQILKDMPYRRIELLKNIRTNYKTFLLSNSNEIHFLQYSKSLLKEFGIDNFNHLFDKAYFSFKENLLKPEAEFYKKTLKDNNLKPEETLFIDDMEQNTIAASNQQIKTIWLKKGIDICDLFNEDYQLNKFAYELII